MLVFQSNYSEWDVECDQIFYTNIKNSNMKVKMPNKISTGLGRTTCAYFMPGDTTIIYASTHLQNAECPHVPKSSDGKYVWPIYDSYDIFVSDLDGKIVKQLTNNKGYDAEATVSPKGDKMYLLLIDLVTLNYTMNIDGSNIQQVTFGLGMMGVHFLLMEKNWYSDLLDQLEIKKLKNIKIY